MASPEYEAFFATIQSQKTGATPTLEELRQAMDAIAMVVPAPEGTMVEPVDAGGVPAEWVSAPNVTSDRVVLYLHGGGYAIGSPAMVRNFVARLSASADARVLSVDYRLGPEHPFPAAVDDAVIAYHWLVAQGHPPERIAVSGESAGGGLTVAMLLALKQRRDQLPAAAVPISPWFDMEIAGDISEDADKVDGLTRGHLEHFRTWYLGEGDRRAPLANPLHADLDGLPPMLILVGEREILLDDARRFVSKAQDAGINIDLEIVPEMIHIWHLFGPMFPEANAASDRVGAYIRERTA